MNRVEFVERLEYLLQDLPEEEREDALSYYRDYLEEAGDEGEEQAIREFGSPERVAAIIRSDLAGHLEDGGEFTDSGYQDERFRDPNYQVVKRMDLPDVAGADDQAADGWRKESGDGDPADREMHQERGAWNGTGQTGGAWNAAGQEHGGAWNNGRSEQYDAWNGDGETGQKRGSWDEQHGQRGRGLADRDWLKRLLRVGLLLLLLGVLSPVLLGVGGSALGVLAAVACIFAAVVVCVGVLTVAACVGAVILLVIGIWTMFFHPAVGVMTLGGGILVLGLALIGIAVSVLVYGKWIPAGIRFVLNTISNILNGRGRRSA